MEKKKINIFDLANAAPSPSEDQAMNNALEAVQTYLNMLNNDEEKIDEFNSIVATFCYDAKKSK